MDLFDATLLDAGVGATPPDGFVLRPLRSSDFGRGFTKLLAQLTRVGDYDATRFAQRFASMWRVNQEQATYLVTVVEDTRRGVIVGTATLVVEQKFLRGTAPAGHIEDVVTDGAVRGLGLGKLLIDTLLRLGDVVGCYKVLLDCSDDNVPFYERCGMQVKERQMVRYYERSKL